MKIVYLSCVVIVLFLVHSSECNIRRKRIVGGQAAAVPPEDDPVVYVYKEDHDARVFGIRERKGGFYTYQGIRYGYPPVGLYRFQRPRPLKLQGLINATRPPPPCVQPHPQNPRRIIGSEDCLFLNIYSAELPDGTSDGLPVLIWIHGGGYRRGSANQYGPGPIIRKKVVLVTVQYRLGSLGFLSAGAPQLSGNAAMFDMSAAIRWVQNYISFFGGDPKNIKTIGQGSGANSAVALGISPVSSRSLNGVVAMSGSAVSPNAVDPKPKDATSELADLLGCPTTPPLQLVRCLQQIKVADLIAADSKLQAFRLAELGPLGSIGGLVSPAPVVEGQSHNGRSLDAGDEDGDGGFGDDDRFLPSFFPQPPMKALNQSNFPAIPLLTGVCKDETGRAVHGEIKERINLVKDKIASLSNYVNNILGNQLAGFAAKASPLGDGLSRLRNNPLFERASSSASSAAEAVNAATKRVSDATTDVLFNLPAALTSSLWSQKAPAYLYSLEHPSKQAATLGQKFLAGLPAIEAARGVAPEDQPLVSHGDDLAFLFDARSLEGDNNDDELTLSDPNDLKLRDYFTSLVANFAQTGTASVPGEKEKSLWSSFSGGKGASYLVLDATPRLGKDFRSCHLALWAGATGQGGGGGDSNGDDCHVLGNLGKAVGGVAGAVGGVRNVLHGGNTGGLGLPLPVPVPGAAPKPGPGTAASPGSSSETQPKRPKSIRREKPKPQPKPT